jgi:L-malate glycosyltransferase
VRRSRVMHVVIAGDIGGAERLLVELATRPLETGADQEVAVITPNRALVEHLTRAGLVVHDRGPARETPLAYLFRSLGPADVKWLTALLFERAIDIVHTHVFGSHVVGTRAARRAGKPQLRTEHGTVHYFDPSCSIFTRWAAARTDRIVAVSEYVRDGVLATEPELVARTSVIRNGVDTAYWSPQDAETAAYDSFSLAIVCRLTKWKRVDLAIRAAALANVDLVVVGDGEERSALETLARKLGSRTRFVGYQRDPRSFVARASAVLSSARDEPLGLSALESLAMGRAVIGIVGGGLAEIVQSEQTGILVEEPTPAALAQAIARARQDPERLRAMGASGRRFAVEHCGIRWMCESYAKVYRELAARARSEA